MNTNTLTLLPVLMKQVKTLDCDRSLYVCVNVCVTERGRLYSRCWKPPSVECVSFVSSFLSLSCLQRLRHRSSCPYFPGMTPIQAHKHTRLYKLKVKTICKISHNTKLQTKNDEEHKHSNNQHIKKTKQGDLSYCFNSLTLYCACWKRSHLTEVMVFFRLQEVKGCPFFFTRSCQQVVKHVVVSKKTDKNEKKEHFLSLLIENLNL